MFSFGPDQSLGLGLSLGLSRTIFEDNVKNQKQVYQGFKQNFDAREEIKNENEIVLTMVSLRLIHFIYTILLLQSLTLHSNDLYSNGNK